MAISATRAAPRRRMRGGTILGFLAGLVTGLAIAVVVAIFVTRAPVPFTSKASRAPERLLEPKTPEEAPDPNKPLQSKTRPQGSAASGDAQAPAASQAPAAAPALPPPEAPKADAKGDAQKDERVTYLLQAGAFKAADDAESMKARLALLGFEARVITAEVNGQTMHRVRVGPYAALDDMNRARARLAENGIEASVVRQR